MTQLRIYYTDLVQHDQLDQPIVLRSCECLWHWQAAAVDQTLSDIAYRIQAEKVSFVCSLDLICIGTTLLILAVL